MKQNELSLEDAVIKFRNGTELLIIYPDEQREDIVDELDILDAYEQGWRVVTKGIGYE